MAVRKLILMSVLAIFAGPAQADYEYKVTGVAAGDVLNIREDVASAGQVSSARIVGTIPPGAAGIRGTGVTVTVGANLWRQVSYGGVTGWVAARFLAELDRADSGSPPDRLQCSGTEPFWSMNFSGSKAVLEDLFSGSETRKSDFVTTPGRYAEGRRHVWSVMAKAADGSKGATAAFIRTDACSDSMSDFTFPIEFVLTEHGPDGLILSGCCQLMR